MTNSTSSASGILPGVIVSAMAMDSIRSSFQAEGNAGAYGRSIVGTKKYRSWKRKDDRRKRNARGGE